METETLPPFNEFERSGEAAVRQAIEDGYLTGGKRHSALAWLARKEEARRLQREASQAEQMDIARSAKDAAWEAAKAAGEAAREAKTANTISTAANTIAKLALAVATFAAIAAVIALIRH